MSLAALLEFCMYMHVRMASTDQVVMCVSSEASHAMSLAGTCVMQSVATCNASICGTLVQ